MPALLFLMAETINRVFLNNDLAAGIDSNGHK
jgi:hypothetical protein